MSRLSLLGNAVKSSSLLRTTRPSHDFPSLLRPFSTEADQANHDSSSVDPFLKAASTGLAYGRLIGISKYTLKSDIIRLLEECALTEDDVKVDYNRMFQPMAMLVQLPSPRAFEKAFKDISRKGRLYKLETVDRSQWDIVAPYNGKTVVVEGLPKNASPDDLERFLSGCEYDATSVQFMTRMTLPDTKLALVRFPSRIEAMNAYIKKNRGFCLNNKITLRVLQ